MRNSLHRSAVPLIAASLSFSSPTTATAQGVFDIQLEGFEVLGDGLGGMPFSLDSLDEFGSALAWLGDLNGDGFDEIAIGAPGTAPGFARDGAVYIVSIDHRGVSGGELLDPVEPGRIATALFGPPGLSTGFGASLAAIGDIDGTGDGEIHTALAVGDEVGSLHILRLNTDGTIKQQSSVSRGPSYGASVAGLRNLDNQGSFEIAVGEPDADVFGDGQNSGRIWIETVSFTGSTVTLSTMATLDSPVPGVRFGSAVSCLGALNDTDSVSDLAVGAPLETVTSGLQGAVYICYLNANGTLSSQVRIDDTDIVPSLIGGEGFGSSLAATWDPLGGATFTMNVDDEIQDLIVGSPFALSGSLVTGDREGAVYILHLNRDGSVLRTEKYGEQEYRGFSFVDFQLAQFGAAVSFIRDIHESESYDIIVGSRFDRVTGNPPNSPGEGRVYMSYIGDAQQYETAEAVLRNVAPNPVSLTSTRPVLGRPWKATVDLSTTGHSMATLLGWWSDADFVLPLGGGQIVLTDLTDPFAFGPAFPGVFQAPNPTSGLVEFYLDLPPALPSIPGLRLQVQAMHAFDVVPFALSNAQDLYFGNF